MMEDIWETLGVAPTTDVSAIRRAYAVKLKRCNPEEDAEGFQSLREAYELALGEARGQWGPRAVDVVESPPEELPPHAEPRADEGLDAHRALQDALFDALQVRASDEALVGAARAVLDSPAMEHVGVQAETEAWFDDLIRTQSPASDAILEYVVDRFGWRDGSGRMGERRGSMARQRLEDLTFLREMRGANHPHNAACKALSAPPPPGYRLRMLFSDVPVQVRRLLATIDAGHYSIRAIDLDPRAQAWWDAYFERPRISFRTWRWAACFAGFFLGLAALAALTAYAWWPLPAIFGAGVAVGWVLTMLFRHYAIDLARAKWERDLVWRAPLALRLGWPWAGLGLMLLAGALPTSTAACVALAVLGLAVALAGWITAEELPEDEVGPRLQGAFLINMFPAAWLFVLMGDLSLRDWLQVAPAVLAGGLVWGRCEPTLMRAWHLHMPGLVRLAAALALLAAIGGAAWHVVSFDLAKWLVPAVFVLMLVQRLPVMALGEEALQVRYYAMFLTGILFVFRDAFSFFGGQGLGVVMGCWLLFGCAVGLLLYLWSEREGFFERGLTHP
jgi:hypothetical protein